MAISVRLDAKTERLVKRLALKRGRGKSEVLREAIALLARAEVTPSQESPFEVVSDLIGCVRGGPRDRSIRTGVRFRELLERRRRRR